MMHRRSAMRASASLMVILLAVGAVACDGGDDAAAAVPVSERHLTAEDAPGTTADPVEKGESADDLDGFITTFSQHLIDPDLEEMRTVFEEAGFQRAGSDVRFFGETHSDTAEHVASAFFEVGSEEGARAVLDWLEEDSMKPCPESCAVQITSFDPQIPDGRGVHRLATADAIEKAGFEGQHPSDDYWVGFTDGSIVYTVLLWGSPGSVSEEQALEIARAYHDRLTGE